MTNLRKSIAVLLSLTMAAGALSACGNNGGASKPAAETGSASQSATASNGTAERTTPSPTGSSR